MPRGEYAYVRAFVRLFPLQSVGFIDQIAASFGCRHTSLQSNWHFVFNPKDSRLEIFVLVYYGIGIVSILNFEMMRCRRKVCSRKAPPFATRGAGRSAPPAPPAGAALVVALHCCVAKSHPTFLK